MSWPLVVLALIVAVFALASIGLWTQHRERMRRINAEHEETLAELRPVPAFTMPSPRAKALAAELRQPPRVYREGETVEMPPVES